MTKTFLFTGAAGFIGSNVILEFASKYPEDRFIVLDKLSYATSDKTIKHLKDLDVEVIEMDINDNVLPILTCAQVDYVYHFAAETHVDNSFRNSIAFTRTNVLGTHNLLECCKVYGKLKKFIHISTDEVYGGNENGEIFGEDSSLLHPTNPYSASKAAAEMLCSAYKRSYGLPIIITRMNNCYGPRQFIEKVIPKFATRYFQGKDLQIHGSGTQSRSFMHVQDVANAFLIIHEKGVIGEVYNVAMPEDKEVTIKELAETIVGLNLNPEYKGKVDFVEDRHFNDQRYVCSSDKITALGWEPKIDFIVGLTQTFKWYNDHPDYFDNASMYLSAHPTFDV